jgi:hypothetical protein
VQDTCTRPVTRQAGALPLSYAVAYKVAGPPGDTAAARGGAEMGARLRSAEVGGRAQVFPWVYKKEEDMPGLSARVHEGVLLLVPLQC